MINIETLRQLLEYRPQSGKLFWMERPASMFEDGEQTSEHNAAAWNARYAGKETFKNLTVSGYRQGGIFYKKYLTHRVVWALVYGEWPEGEIDHINGDKSDNRIENLRIVTRVENMRNVKRHRINKSGVCGVRWNERAKKWIAFIGINKKHKHLGSFNDFNTAVQVRKKAEAEFGFHENHGKAA